MAKNRKPRARGRRRFRKFLIAAEVLIMLVATIGAYGWGKVGQINTVALDENKIQVNDEVKASSKKLTGVTNVALFGVDSRTGDLNDANTDTMIIASINNDAQTINMCSLYRDTYVDVTGSGDWRKANAAYAMGGPEGAISMMNRSMDLNLDKYITVDFNALSKTIDALGGLDIEMTGEEAYWTNGYIRETSDIIGVEQNYLPNEDGGTYHCDGIQATSFCRIRYTAGDDFKRTERQRLILTKIFEKAKTMDLSTLNTIADQVFPLIQTNMTLAEMLSIGSNILTYNMGQSLGMPFNKTTGNIPGVGSSVLATDWAGDVAAMHEQMFGEAGYTPSQNVQSMSSKMAGTSFGDSSYSDSSYDDSEDDTDYSSYDYSEDEEDYSSDTGYDDTDYSDAYDDETYSDDSEE